VRERPLPAAAPPPIACPRCGSRELTTSGKRDDAAGYWRCGACGEVWNNGRRKTPAQRWG